MKLNVDLIYPIGSIYMNMNSTSPEVLFGGQWQQLKARFLCGVGELDTANSSTFYGATPGGYTIWAGETAGENLHTLSVNEMPSHNHGMQVAGTPLNTEGNTIGFRSGTNNGSGDFWNMCPTRTNSGSHNGWITYTGNNWSHNNMPPYFAVYMWKRIA